jgi:hypothetical protein
VVKPAVHRLLHRLRLYRKLHNGFCDIRKGHKHYSLKELTKTFRALNFEQAVHFGYFFDPVFSWADAIFRRVGRFPGYGILDLACRKEFGRDYGTRSFNVVVKFSKPI